MTDPTRQSAEQAPRPQTLADRWFTTLDQRQIQVGRRRWTARVTGIHLDGTEAWIQIAAGATQDRSLVLHLSGWTTIGQVVAAMKTKPLETASYPRVISLIPRA